MNRKKEIIEFQERISAIEELLNNRTIIQIQNVSRDLRDNPEYTQRAYSFLPYQYVPISISNILTKLLLYLKLDIEIIPSTQEDIIIKKTLKKVSK